MKVTDSTTYRFGSCARHLNWQVEECPFEPLTDAWFDWLDGWKDADEYIAEAAALTRRE